MNCAQPSVAARGEELPGPSVPQSLCYSYNPRTIGHSFLHGGFSFSGLSLPVVTLLTGGSIDTAASALTLEDCPDIDHRETIVLLKNAELTAEENTKVTDLCLSWDLPFPTSTNHVWLFQELLSHAVLHRVKQPIKQIRKGLKQTGIWPLLSDRPDVHPLIFPREPSEEFNPQTVILSITWPQPNLDSDEDELKLPSHYQTYKIFHQDLMMALSSIHSGFGLV
ncbi:uncharacterized protein LOC123978187 [Micropterus dolomieu]|uniref:uncharacterized protein LOC123978187 n=1 Tax=Micropterus dolomieu TaxID=147949 RepID=UPI001E8DCA4B|nr:uncharacterized protein LOC123978187 [Micropterus dolomieu]